MVSTENLLTWVRAAFPYNGPVVSGHAPQGGSPILTSAFNIASGYSATEAGLTDDDARFRLGCGLNGLATALRDADRHDDAASTFTVAYLILASVHPRGAEPQHYSKAIGYAFANLKALGVESADGMAAPAIPAAPYIDIAQILSDSPTVVVGGSHGNWADPLAAEDGGASPSASGETAGTLAELLTKSVPAPEGDRIRLEEVLRELRTYLDSYLGKSGILARDLGFIIEGDSKVLSGILPEVPTDARSLLDACRQIRAFAYHAGNDDVERRRRWLCAATLNHAVWKLPQKPLETNEPQVQIDLVGYTSAILMDHRYNDADRDLLLDCAEGLVRLASGMKPVVFGRFPYLRNWVLSAVGTHLVLAGPSPSTPADSYYDERVYSPSAPSHRGLQRAEREEWPKLLLAQWQTEAELANGACYALASVSGWEAARAAWLVHVIYQDSRDGEGLAEGFWHDRLMHLMERVDRIRVAANPWNAQDPSASRESMVLSDATGRFVIPNSVLRAAAAQAVGPGEFITVHGQPFAGRRVPTYLLTSRFGPFAILKIDYREKVQREVRNFELYARRLHQSHRPSDCDAHPMDMYLGESGTPLRAIETSYVFDERDQPLTLGSWLRSTSTGGGRTAVNSFLLSSLRPWLAHIRRDRIDLRAEYPIFRPAPIAGKQFPDNWAETELRRLEADGVADSIGFPLTRTPRACAWLEGIAWGTVARELTGGLPFVNPLWLACEIAELGSSDLSWILDSFETGVRDFDTLLSLSHGDLHVDNILCASAREGAPRMVLIDFESAHEGHVCKDLARLEASLLAQTFDWEALGQSEGMLRWFCGSLADRNVMDRAAPSETTTELAIATSICGDLRRVAGGCGQGHWPIRDDEYLFALFAGLLPMVRYPTLSDGQRRLALLFATVTGSVLLRKWETIEGR